MKKRKALNKTFTTLEKVPVDSPIQRGDLILFKGSHPITSPLIRWFTDSSYTHVGMAIMPGWVYEMDMDRKLAIYPIRKSDYDVYRYKESLTDAQMKHLLETCLSRAESNVGYDWWKIASLALEKIFRLVFFWDHPSREICSEIVDRLYQEIGIDLVPDRYNGHVTPHMIATSPELILVHSHHEKKTKK